MILLKVFSRFSEKALSFFALCFCIYLALLYIAATQLGRIYNSDIISIPYLYIDLLQGGHLSQWKFPATMCFFPDAVIYFLLAFITQQPKMAILIFIITQYCLYYLLSIVIGKQLIQTPNDLFVFKFSILLSIFLYAIGYLGQDIFYAYAFSGHFGAALMYLFGTFLILRSFVDQRVYCTILLGFICFFTVFSDILYITQFVLPSILTLYLLSRFTKQQTGIYKKNIISLSIGTLASYFFYISSADTLHLHMHHNSALLRRYWPHDLWLATQMIAHDFMIFYQSNSIILILFFLYIALTIRFLKNIVTQPIESSNIKLPLVFVHLLLMITIIIGYFSIIFSDNNVMSQDISLRHYQPLILFPVFIGLPLHLIQWSCFSFYFSKIYPVLLISLGLYGLSYSTRSPFREASIKMIYEFYPSSIQCIDRYKDHYHLTNGITYYWNAKQFTFLSKKQITFVAIKNTVKSPRKTTESHVSQTPIIDLDYDTIHHFLNKDFNFIIVNEAQFPTQADAQQLFGKPDEILRCSEWKNDPGLIYVFNHGVPHIHWSQSYLSSLLVRKKNKLLA